MPCLCSWCLVRMQVRAWCRSPWSWSPWSWSHGAGPHGAGPMELVPMELVPMELVPMELVRGVNVRGEAAGTRRAQGFACPRSGDGRPGSGAVVSSGPSERRGANVGQVSRGPPERYLSTPLSPGSAGAAGPARTPRSDGVCEQPQGSGTEIRSVAKEDFYLS
jgi:hypothetical protein